MTHSMKRVYPWILLYLVNLILPFASVAYYFFPEFYFSGDPDRMLIVLGGFVALFIITLRFFKRYLLGKVHMELKFLETDQKSVIAAEVIRIKLANATAFIVVTGTVIIVYYLGI